MDISAIAMTRSLEVSFMATYCAVRLPLEAGKVAIPAVLIPEAVRASKAKEPVRSEPTALQRRT